MSNSPRPMSVGGRPPPPTHQSHHSQRSLEPHPSMTVEREVPAPKRGEKVPERDYVAGVGFVERGQTAAAPVPPAPVREPVDPSVAPAPNLPQAPAPMPEIIGAKPPPPPEKISGRTIVNDLREAARPPEVPVQLERAIGPTHVRLTLPSASVFYDWTDLQLRPFGVLDLAGLARARKDGNISQQLDVLDGCMNRDVRELTIPDLRFVMYWLKLNSYMKTPFDVEWTSKYGNLNKHTITASDLVIDVLEMSREEANRWRALGISPARVRDMEIFETENLDDETLWLYERAQFLEGTTVKDKIDRLVAGGIGLIEDIQHFDQIVRYGVEESFTARDHHFTVEGYQRRLRDEADQITRRMSIIVDPELATSMAMRIQDINDELAELEARVAKGEEVVADEEKRVLNISFGDFFSRL